MKKLYFGIFGVCLMGLSILSSCNCGNDATTQPPPAGTSTTLTFKKDFTAYYDLYVVDTADASGNNPDRIILSSRRNVQEIIVDTGITYVGKNHVARIVTFDATLTPPNDTNYFYQDPNGDLYRYNFGFNVLNEFSVLTQAIGSKVDAGWVLAAKLTSPVGTKWVAKYDTVTIQSFGIQVYLESDAEMMADTTIFVGTDTLKAKHVQHVVNATTPAGLPLSQTGKIVIDSYMAPSIGAVVIDFFKHATVTGALANAKAQGQFKIITSYSK